MKNKAAVALGRLGGLAATEKQREAARKNGKLGGRPRGIAGVNIMDLTGKTFGRYTVLREAKRTTPRRAWVCRCACGKVRTVQMGTLRSGHSRSCGCLHLDVITTHGAKLGGSTTPEYAAWIAMNERCSNPKHKAFKNYGGRGISVCREWKSDFASFLRSLGKRPTPGHSLDRKDNSLGYFPENCRWSTRVRQENNKRSNHLMTVDGLTLTVAQHCRRVGVNSLMVYPRLYMGWSDEAALYTPCRKQNIKENR